MRLKHDRNIIPDPIATAYKEGWHKGYEDGRRYQERIAREDIQNARKERDIARNCIEELKAETRALTSYLNNINPIYKHTTEDKPKAVFSPANSELKQESQEKSLQKKVGLAQRYRMGASRLKQMLKKS